MDNGTNGFASMAATRNFKQLFWIESEFSTRLVSALTYYSFFNSHFPYPSHLTSNPLS